MQQEPARRRRAERNVVIIGEGSVQNRLFAGLIEERLDAACQVRSVDESRAWALLRGALVLLDVGGMSPEDIEGQVRALLTRAPYGGIALMNADRARARQFAGSPVVRGIFFDDASQEQLMQGIRAMLVGQCWLPGSLMAAHLERARLAAPGVRDDRVELTRKERETLQLLARGYSNAAIAKRLGVSMHTVKTHLYNVFRKTRSANRVQAAKWSLEHLAAVDQPAANSATFACAAPEAPRAARG